jgi:tetratricopeptide (TPR) repeat protein
MTTKTEKPKLFFKKRRQFSKTKSSVWLETKKWLFKFFLLFASLFIASIILYLFFLPKNKFQKVREKILTQPDNLDARLELIKIYLANNQFEKAETELLKLQSDKVARLPSPDGEANGGQAKPQNEKIKKLWQRKYEEDPKEIQKQAQEWQNLLTQYPDYRDGWLQLALLYLKLNEIQEAKKTLEKAQQLSPNYEVTKEFQEGFFGTFLGF